MASANQTAMPIVTTRLNHSANLSSGTTYPSASIYSLTQFCLTEIPNSAHLCVPQVHKGFGHGINKPKEPMHVMQQIYDWFSKHIWGEEPKPAENAEDESH